MFSALICRNSRLLIQCLSKQSKPPIRSLNLPIKASKAVLLNKSNHRLIYHFPYISLIAAFLRTKVWVPAVSVPISPVVYFLDASMVSTVILLLSAGIYYVFGRLFSKVLKGTVGKMYVNNDGDITNVIISSLDAYGRRIDRIHPLNDIINCDFPSTSARYVGFIQLGIQNSNIYYNLNINNCKIKDEMAFDCVLGGRFDSEDINKEKGINADENFKKQLH